MKFIFLNSTNENWSGITIRDGTHNSSISKQFVNMTECLAKNHNVKVVSIYNIYPSLILKYNQVEYTNLNNLSIGNCDILILHKPSVDIQILSLFGNIKKIFFFVEWYNNLEEDDLYILRKNEHITLIYSSIIIKNILTTKYNIENLINIVIAPCYFDNIYYNNEEKENYISFFEKSDTTIINDVMNCLEDYQLCTPFDSFTNLKSRVVKMNFQNKIELLKKSKYYICSCIYDNKFVVDNFNYFILEALLCNVIVIAPRIKLIEEHFGDLIDYYDIDDLIDNNFNIINKYLFVNRILHVLLRSKTKDIDTHSLNLYYQHNHIIDLMLYQNVQFLNMNDEFKKMQYFFHKFKMIHGTLEEISQKQQYVLKYLKGKEKVLEIGSSVGENSLVIGAILENSKNLVCLECNSYVAKQLIENRDANHLQFHVLDKALSKNPLVQDSYGITHLKKNAPSDSKEIDIITIEEIRNKYQIHFDTLVVTCEGGFYHILKEMPDVLNGIRLIIITNDFTDFNEKEYVDFVLTSNQFNMIDVSEGNSMGLLYKKYNEVWKRF